jgi:hypothetical protein
MDHAGFDGKEHAAPFPQGKWLLIFAAGNIVWWTAWLVLCVWTRAYALLGAILVPLPLLTFWGLTGEAIDLVPVVLASFVAYRLQFEDRSGWSLAVWIGAGWVISFLTRFLFLLLGFA